MFTNLFIAAALIAGGQSTPKMKRPNLKRMEPNISGVYADWIEHHGNFYGTQIVIYKVTEYWLAFHELDEQELTPHLVKVAVKGNSIQFTLPRNPSGVRVFNGSISSGRLIGSFNDSNKTYSLDLIKQ